MSINAIGSPTGSSYSFGIIASSSQLLFTSGIVSMSVDGKIIAPDNMEAQARYVFDQIEKLLAEQNATLNDVVKITTFVTDMSKYSEFSKVRSEVFSKPFPASSTVGVNELVKPGLLVEVEAIATV
mgnify:FL=1